MAKKSEGQMVREAMDGPSVEHDALIDHMGARIREEHARSSDGSESAAKVAKLLEETGLNSQAYSWGKSILKKLPKKDGQAKAMDVIRSLKLILPMLESHVGGQTTADMFDGKPPPDGGGETQPEPDDEVEASDGPDIVEDDEQVDFNAAVDENEGNVVTPIQFGGDVA